jgi:hypothetical protein
LRASVGSTEAANEVVARFGVVGPKRDNSGRKTPLELFLAAMRGWESYLRRCMPEEKPNAVGQLQLGISCV